MDIEAVERKGLGHPDTIADALANEISRQLVNESMVRAGGVAKHSIDKLVLAGGTAELGFGRGRATSPMRCLVVGKFATGPGADDIPLPEILQRAAERVFDESLAPAWRDELPRIEFTMVTNSGVGTEHPAGYYNPQTARDLDPMGLVAAANDSAMVFGHAVATPLERLVFGVESSLTDSAWRYETNQGTDVKVLGVRNGSDVRLQVAVPYLAQHVASEAAYLERLDAVRMRIHDIASNFDGLHVALHLNTKDQRGTGYLTLVGSSLDKGDQGAVGRGNNFSGLISMMRPQSMESHAGKNPIRSAGRLYPHLCRRISQEMFNQHGVDANVGLQSSNGQPLIDPTIIVSPHHYQVGRWHDLPVVSLSEEDILSARRTLLSDDELSQDLKGRLASYVPA